MIHFNLRLAGIQSNRITTVRPLHNMQKVKGDLIRFDAKLLCCRYFFLFLFAESITYQITI